MSFRSFIIYFLLFLSMVIVPGLAFAQAPGENVAKLFTQLTAQDVSLVARLKPPTTTYEIENWLAEISNEFNKNSNSLQFSYLYSDVTWKPEISCGKFSRVLRRDVTIWTHENGTGQGLCPHAGETVHPGTISVKATFEGNLRKITDEKATTLLTMRWSTECLYKDGSKEGRAPCSVTFSGAEGPYASYVSGTKKSEESSAELSPSLIVFTGAFIAALAAAAGVYMFGKKKHKRS